MCMYSGSSPLCSGIDHVLCTCCKYCTILAQLLAGNLVPVICSRAAPPEGRIEWCGSLTSLTQLLIMATSSLPPNGKLGLAGQTRGGGTSSADQFFFMAPLLVV